MPISVIPLKKNQLINQGIFWRERDPKQSTDFSFTRFLVPKIMDYKGWAIFMDCDMLCQDDLANLWDQRNNEYSVLCVKHNHIPKDKFKFLGEVQSSYPMKNWSSLMLLNCERCKNLTVDYVNNATGLDLHRFKWLKSEKEIGEIKGSWNYLIENNEEEYNKSISLIHWTLGGPWFKDQRNRDNDFDNAWFLARESSTKLYD